MIRLLRWFAWICWLWAEALEYRQQTLDRLQREATFGPDPIPVRVTNW